jgi:hypothetical protein
MGMSGNLHTLAALRPGKSLQCVGGPPDRFGRFGKRGNEFPSLKIEPRFLAPLARNVLCVSAPEIRRNSEQNVSSYFTADNLCCVSKTNQLMLIKITAFYSRNHTKPIMHHCVGKTNGTIRYHRGLNIS